MPGKTPDATSEDKTIQADTITYDSASSLFYAYGEDGRDILIAQQGRVGQRLVRRAWPGDALQRQERPVAD